MERRRRLARRRLSAFGTFTRRWAGTGAVGGIQAHQQGWLGITGTGRASRALSALFGRSTHSAPQHPCPSTHPTRQVLPTAVLWGVGTALGEVPPYALSYHAAKAGKRSAEVEAMLGVGSSGGGQSGGGECSLRHLNQLVLTAHGCNAAVQALRNLSLRAAACAVMHGTPVAQHRGLLCVAALLTPGQPPPNFLPQAH